jgi:energy-coupling factor transport system substrate-specific component
MTILGDQKYYFISLLIILCAMVPFVMIFEIAAPGQRDRYHRQLAAIAVAGRSVAFMLPEFKPVIALVIITGYASGEKQDFLSVRLRFCFQLFFRTGSLDPVADVQLWNHRLSGWSIVCPGRVTTGKVALCIFGAASTLLIYGGIMDTASVLIIYQGQFSKALLLASYAAGLGFNMIHALSTVVFLLILSGPMIEKLERIKRKYGLIEP